MSRMRIVMVASVVAIASIVAGAILVRGSWLRVWPKLRSETARVGVIPGFVLSGSADEGSAMCVISCDEPRITIVMATNLPMEDACVRLESTVRRVAERVGPWDPYRLTPSREARCHYQGHLPNVDADATLSASLEPGNSEALALRTQAVEGLRLQPNRLYAYLQFNSGID